LDFNCWDKKVYGKKTRNKDRKGHLRGKIASTLLLVGRLFPGFGEGWGPRSSFLEKRKSVEGGINIGFRGT